MISKGRNILQAQIDDTTIVLDRLLSEVPKQIKASFKELEKEIDEAGVGLSHEEAYTVKESLARAYRMEDETEMLESFYKSMVIMICCYCERTLLSMLPIDIQKQLKYKGKKIESYYKAIQEHYDIKLKSIGELWRGQRGFIKFRNDITHGREYDAELLTYENLNSNLKMVKHLLRTTADIISRHPNFINHY